MTLFVWTTARVCVAWPAGRVAALTPELFLARVRGPQIAIDKLEQKLRTLSTGIYTMQEFVKSKESENNYTVLAHQINTLIDEVNTSVVRALA